jgi:hypothetical protein
MPKQYAFGYYQLRDAGRVHKLREIRLYAKQGMSFLAHASATNSIGIFLFHGK